MTHHNDPLPILARIDRDPEPSPVASCLARTAVAAGQLMSAPLLPRFGEANQGAGWLVAPPNRMLVVTRGLPASGKTFAARDYRRLHRPGEVVRVNRDDLRAMLHGGWLGTPDAEAQVTAVQRAAVAAAFTAGARVVIVDDTNLLEAYLGEWRDLADRQGAELEVWDFRAVPFETCLARNASRPAAADVVPVSARVPDATMRQLHEQLLAGLREH